MPISRTEQSNRDDYINKLFAQEDGHLSAIREALRADGKEGINVGPFEGKILHLLMKMVGAEKVVEVGTLYGYSALWIARALPETGKLYCLEKSQENFAKAQALLQKTEVSGRVEVICGDALETLNDLSGKGPFDVVFIDANKGGYADYLNWAEKNLRPGGLIIGDNTFLFGHMFGEERDPGVEVSAAMKAAMTEFNERLAASPEFDSVMLPTAEGMTLALKK